MAFQTPITISKALESIGCPKYVLPAIQREFVWRPNQIERLFDSLMRGYPTGSFLFWIVKRESIEQYKFYDFMLNYHERDNAHCTSGGAVNQDEITAVLDGQQRLTAMNIGLRGSYAYKLPRLWWKSPDAFPARHLHLNILAEAEENEAGMRHDVRFLTRREAERRDENHCWYRVGEILNAQDAVDLNDFLVDRELANRRGPFRVLAGLHKAVHTEPVIAYYQEEDQGLDKVLDIFIRTNSGGTTLSYSDMLMSMATAQWENLDAREAIHGTIAEINRIGDGFGFSQDFLLKAGLMLAGVGSVQFEVANFNRKNMKLLEDRWESITHAVCAAVALVARFGFSQGSLSANNAVLPIAYYLYRRDTPAGFLSQVAYWTSPGLVDTADRATMPDGCGPSVINRGHRRCQRSGWARGVDRGQNRNWNVVTVELLGFENVSLQNVDQRLQHPGRAPNPASQRRSLHIHTDALVDLRLPVQRKMIRIPGHHDMRQQPGSGQAAVDRPIRSRLLHDAVAAAATELGAYGANHFEVGRHVLQSFRDILSRLRQRPAAVQPGVSSR